MPVITVLLPEDRASAVSPTRRNCARPYRTILVCRSSADHASSTSPTIAPLPAGSRRSRVPTLLLTSVDAAGDALLFETNTRVAARRQRTHYITAASIQIHVPISLPYLPYCTHERHERARRRMLASHLHSRGCLAAWAGGRPVRGVRPVGQPRREQRRLKALLVRDELRLPPRTAGSLGGGGEQWRAV